MRWKSIRSFGINRWLVGMLLVCACGQEFARVVYSQDNSMIKLIEALSDTNRDIRDEAVNALVKLGPAAIDPLVAALKSKNDVVRQEATGALGRIRDPRAVEPLIGCFEGCGCYCQL